MQLYYRIVSIFFLIVSVCLSLSSSFSDKNAIDAAKEQTNELRLAKQELEKQRLIDQEKAAERYESAKNKLKTEKVHISFSI